MGRFIVAILVVVGLAYLGIRGYGWFKQGGEGAAQAGGWVEEARALRSEGKTAEATALLEKAANQTKDGAAAVNALMLLAETAQESGDTEAALAFLKRAKDDFPLSLIHI